jgi:hypothetical protein
VITFNSVDLHEFVNGENPPFLEHCSVEKLN